MRVHHQKKCDEVRVHHEKKSDGCSEVVLGKKMVTKLGTQDLYNMGNKFILRAA